MLKTLTFNKQTAVTSSAMSFSEDPFCPLSLWCLQCCWLAFCRVQNVLGLSTASCHVVTSNGVIVCSSQFPPTVSKHYQHQHSATPKTIPAIWNTNNPSCCDIQGTAPSVQHHGSLCSQPQQSPLWCLSSPANTQHNVTQFTVYSVPTPATDPLRIPAYSVKLSTYNSTFESLYALHQVGDKITQLNNERRMLNCSRINCKKQI